MFRKFFVNPILSFWNSIIGNVDPYVGYTSQGKAAIYSDLAYKNFKNTLDASKNLPKNLESMNMKKFVTGGAIAAGCIAAGAIAPVPSVCAAAKWLGASAVAHPLSSLGLTAIGTFHKEMMEMSGVLSETLEAAANISKAMYFAGEGLYNGDKSPISNEVEKLFSRDVDDYVNVIKNEIDSPLSGEAQDLDFSLLLSS